jgi:hypothetical protein
MASSSSTANDQMTKNANIQMVNLITQQTIDLLAALKNDVSQAKAFSEEDRKNCVAICQRAEQDYNRVKKEFLEETLILIDQALETSDENVLQQVHRGWSLQLELVTRRCERIAAPIVEMLRTLSKNDSIIRKKYWGI